LSVVEMNNEVFGSKFSSHKKFHIDDYV